MRRLLSSFETEMLGVGEMGGSFNGVLGGQVGEYVGVKMDEPRPK